MNVQVRISVSHNEALELMDDYIKRSAQALAFEHEADEDVSRTHTHLYLFGLPLKRPDDAVRDHLRLYLAKTEYMASTTAKKGIRELTPVGAYTYGTTPSIVDPKYTKGFSEEELSEYKQHAIKFYEPKKERVLIIHETEQKPDNVWSYFYEKLLRTPECKEYNVNQFKRWIMADYLNRCRPIPRQADLNRYAFSLYMLRNMKPDENLRMEDIPLNLL